jgi:hypothetical protein
LIAVAPSIIRGGLDEMPLPRWLAKIQAAWSAFTTPLDTGLPLHEELKKKREALKECGERNRDLQAEVAALKTHVAGLEAAIARKHDVVHGDQAIWGRGTTPVGPYCQTCFANSNGVKLIPLTRNPGGGPAGQSAFCGVCYNGVWLKQPGKKLLGDDRGYWEDFNPR